MVHGGRLRARSRKHRANDLQLRRRGSERSRGRVEEAEEKKVVRDGYWGEIPQKNGELVEERPGGVKGL